MAAKQRKLTSDALEKKIEKLKNEIKSQTDALGELQSELKVRKEEETAERYIAASTAFEKACRELGRADIKWDVETAKTAAEMFAKLKPSNGSGAHEEADEGE